MADSNAPVAGLLLMVLGGTMLLVGRKSKPVGSLGTQLIKELQAAQSAGDLVATQYRISEAHSAGKITPVEYLDLMDVWVEKSLLLFPSGPPQAPNPSPGQGVSDEIFQQWVSLIQMTTTVTALQQIQAAINDPLAGLTSEQYNSLNTMLLAQSIFFSFPGGAR